MKTHVIYFLFIHLLAGIGIGWIVVDLLKMWK